MAGWSVMFFSGKWPLWGWWLMAMVELAVPVWAERVHGTPWHSHHIAERYGLFTIIVFVWGYGHYFIFASVAAVGAGLSLRVDHVVGHSALSDVQAAAAVMVPV